MPAQDTSHIKEKILSNIKVGGPKLPVHIAKGTGLSILFSSAFLSELISEKKIKMSNMRVGSSPIYYLPGQEQKLEGWAIHLKSKEREAFEFLKKEKILEDKKQEPAIRVALRAIKDFAIPFEDNGELFWRYFIAPEQKEKPKENELKIIEKEKLKEDEEIKIEREKPKENELKIIEKEKLKEDEEKELGIFEKEEKPKKTKNKTSVKKQSAKENEKFFNKVKDSLLKREMEIIGIEGFGKKELSLKVKNKEKEFLLIAYNKRRIDENDIIKAFKKAKEKDIEYMVLSVGEATKKIQDLINASKKLLGIQKIE